MKNKITIATRKSRLAIRQSEITKGLLLAQFPDLEIDFLEVTTFGDIDQTTPLSEFGGTGVFVKGLEQKLLSGEADIAVHSLKDVPSISHPDLLLAAFPDREDVRDVLITNDNKTWGELKEGSIIGTSSPARQEQLKRLRPDLVFKNIRGNVDSRIDKVIKGEYDATILAAAGLKRLGYDIESQNYFSLDEMVPSPGQGALVIQIRRDKLRILEKVIQINNEAIKMQVLAERRFMEIIGGGCRFPVAAHAELKNQEVTFRAIAYKPEFKKMKKIKVDTTGDRLYKVVNKIALEMLEN